jgi:hypothetical protein
LVKKNKDVGKIEAAEMKVLRSAVGCAKLNKIKD